MRALLLAVAATALLAVSPVPVRAEIAECDSNRMSNADLGNCLARVLRRDDAALNRAFQAALASIDQETHLTAEQRNQWKDALRRAQRAWIAFRDVDCGEMIGWEWYGGTGRSAAELTCQVERTRARTADFRQRYGQR
jgi:uncharacterized protein YecT (DUF1311 family)